MSYSLDLRQRVVGAVERGMSRADVIATFAISSGTLTRWIARSRRGLDLAPISPPGPLPSIASHQHPALQAQLVAHPDATLAQHADLWNAAFGTSLSQWTLGRAVRSMGWTRKKRRSQLPSESQRSVPSSSPASVTETPETSLSSMKWEATST